MDMWLRNTARATVASPTGTTYIAIPPAMRRLARGTKEEASNCCSRRSSDRSRMIVTAASGTAIPPMTTRLRMLAGDDGLMIGIPSHEQPNMTP